jgi:hypothetical protein
MSRFVDECRKEWKRLGVPDAAADEMAAELAADLAEAKAEGASAEDVLGAAAFDPRAFARAWATERGVVARRRGRPLLLAGAVAAFAVVAIAGAVLVAASSPSEPRRLAVDSPDRLVRVFPLAPGGPPRIVGVGTRYVFPPGQSLSSVPAPEPVVVSVDGAVESSDSGFDARVPGLVLLAIGLAGVVTVTSFGLLRTAAA